MLAALSEFLERITGSSGEGSFAVDDLRAANACFVVARDDDKKAVGCAALRPLTPNIAELKRMFAVPGESGVGSELLAFLETKAAQMGYREIWLETRKVNTKAMSFYQRRGYKRIPNFGKYATRPEAVCFGKSVGGIDRPTGASS